MHGGIFLNVEPGLFLDLNNFRQSVIKTGEGMVNKWGVRLRFVQFVPDI